MCISYAFCMKSLSKLYATYMQLKGIVATVKLVLNRYKGPKRLNSVNKNVCHGNHHHEHSPPPLPQLFLFINFQPLLFTYRFRHKCIISALTTNQSTKMNQNVLTREIR